MSFGEIVGYAFKLKIRVSKKRYLTQQMEAFFPFDIYLFKVNNGNTSTMCEICSKLTIKTPERRQ